MSNNLQYKIALLNSEHSDAVPFYLSETASSVLKTHHSDDQPTLLPALTLDEVSEEYGFGERTCLLKLDVQGFELEVLSGGTRSLKNTNMVLMEVSLLDLYIDSPLVRDVINFMYDFDFVLYDICSGDIRRPLDNALWQSDFLFVKNSSTLREKKYYFKDV
jgi:hypothetical protein